MAGFTPYDQLAMAEFTPLTSQEVLMPAQYQRERHDKLDEAYGEITNEIEKAGAILDANQNSPDLKAKYDAYIADLTNVRDELMGKGLTPDSTRRMFELKSRYQRDVAPVGVAAQLRATDQSAYIQQMMKDPTYEGWDPALYSLDSYVANGMQSQLKAGVSGNDVFKRSSEIFSNFKNLLSGKVGKAIANNPEVLPFLKSTIDGIESPALLRVLTRTGLTADDVANIRKNPALNSVINQLSEAYNFSQFDQEAQKRLYWHASQGAFFGIGKDDVNIMNNPDHNIETQKHIMDHQFALQAAKEEMEARAAAEAAGGGGEPASPWTIHSTKPTYGEDVDSYGLVRAKQAGVEMQNRILKQAQAMANYLGIAGARQGQLNSLMDANAADVKKAIEKRHRGTLRPGERELAYSIGKAALMEEIVTDPLYWAVLAGNDTGEMYSYFQYKVSGKRDGDTVEKLSIAETRASTNAGIKEKVDKFKQIENIGHAFSPVVDINYNDPKSSYKEAQRINDLLNKRMENGDLAIMDPVNREMFNKITANPLYDLFFYEPGEITDNEGKFRSYAQTGNVIWDAHKKGNFLHDTSYVLDNGSESLKGQKENLALKLSSIQDKKNIAFTFNPDTGNLGSSINAEDVRAKIGNAESISWSYRSGRGIVLHLMNTNGSVTDNILFNTIPWDNDSEGTLKALNRDIATLENPYSSLSFMPEGEKRAALEKRKDEKLNQRVTELMNLWNARLTPAPKLSGTVPASRDPRWQ
jgi:hypothetical protein